MKQAMRNLRKIIPTLIIAFAATTLCGSSSFGQAVVNLENPELLMGNLMKMTVDVPMPNDSARVEFPLLAEAAKAKRKYVGLVNDTIELQVAHTRSVINLDGVDYMRYALTIQAFDSGRYELPEFEFIVDGQPETSDRVTLDVLPVKVKADDQIDGFSDIADPFDVNPNPEEMEEAEEGLLIWWLIAAAFIVLLLGGYLFYRYRKTGQLGFKRQPQPPYAEALSRLRKLQRQNLPQKGKTKEYYTRLTDIVRRYLHKQFGIKSIEKTTSEILYEVGQHDNLAQYETVLKSIFETADFVKFAKVNPSVVENSRCMTEAERFVEASRPIEEEKKGGKA